MSPAELTLVRSPVHPAPELSELPAAEGDDDPFRSHLTVAQSAIEKGNKIMQESLQKLLDHTFADLSKQLAGITPRTTSNAYVSNRAQSFLCRIFYQLIDVIV